MSERVFRPTAVKNRSAMNAEEHRRRREEVTVELRKQKKEESLSKRRNIPSIAVEDSDDESTVGGISTQEELNSMIQAVFTGTPDEQYDATMRFRKLLSKERNPPIQEVIECGVIPHFVNFLSSDHAQLQFEAAWALTNIASGSSEQTQVVIANGAIPVFVQLLSSRSADVREQAVWALGNIAGDSPACRDYVLAAQALPPLIQILHDSTNKVSMLRNATWTLSNFCRGKNPQPDWNTIQPALPVLARLIYANDEEVLTDACWAISYLSDGSNEKIQAVIESGVCRRLVELLQHPSIAVQTPALRAVGNIVTGDDVQTQIIINSGALPNLLGLLSSPKEGIRKEACWTISNITAGNASQIEAVINANLIPPLIEILAHADYKTKKEACWAISNATSGGLAKPELIQFIVQQGCIKPLCDLLVLADPKIVQVALDGLENILRVGEANKSLNSGVNIYADYIDSADGVSKIFNLQNHDNADIYRKSYSIINRYYNEEEDETGLEGSVAVDAASGAFTFGADAGGNGMNTENNNFNFGP
ncbi:Importin alpha subunit (Karyopherin alpha subunit) (Serine-rich RNA polymerase I suppressor protein) [Blyttiomyces sp. JEL0837]|nr:Importin alpha subunit (Karyopherin alpha subunit) (Serine-rich RNA polymerase I suppressor protein) [Blyttiomyces sp. JEL0837]